MPSVGTQLASAILSVVGLFLALAAILNNRWAVEWRGRDSLQQQSDGHYIGLWVRCEHQPTALAFVTIMMIMLLALPLSWSVPAPECLSAFCCNLLQFA